MVGKPIVDIMETHIGFGHIRPLEGSTGVFLCILWRISRFLTSRSLCSLTCPHFVQLSTELFFASYSTGFKLHFESVYRIFPTKIKKTAQEQPSPFFHFTFLTVVIPQKGGQTGSNVFPRKVNNDQNLLLKTKLIHLVILCVHFWVIFLFFEDRPRRVNQPTDW